LHFLKLNIDSDCKNPGIRIGGSVCCIQLWIPEIKITESEKVSPSEVESCIIKNAVAACNRDRESIPQFQFLQTDEIHAVNPIRTILRVIHFLRISVCQQGVKHIGIRVLFRPAVGRDGKQVSTTSTSFKRVDTGASDVSFCSKLSLKECR